MTFTLTQGTARWALLLLLLTAANAAAEPVEVIGAGTLSCGAWMEARSSSNTSQTNQVIQWTAGFLAAHNIYRSKTNKQAVAQDLPTISLWHDSYCRNNPTHNVFSSGSALVEELGGVKALHPWKR